MVDKNISVKVYSQRGLQAEGITRSVLLESSNGQIQFLTDHIEYVGLLGIGLLEFTDVHSSALVRVVLTEGFCSFSDGHLLVLADEADPVDLVDRDSYDNEREQLVRVVEREDSRTPEWVVADRKLRRIHAIDRVVGH